MQCVLPVGRIDKINRAATKNMTYQQTTKYLFNLKRFGSKLDLSNITMLLELVDRPQDKFPSVLVGGTSGKFSVVQTTAAILQKAGYKVGTFTSPHLSEYTERFCINGREISRADITRLAGRLKKAADIMNELENYRHPTFFEMSVAMAFIYFVEKKIDIAVVEVGIGGRLDATNTLNPLVSVITHVNLEHTHILGKTRSKIAQEKVEIVREEGVLVTAEENSNVLDVFREKCRERKAKLVVLGKNVKLNILEQDLRGQKFSLSAGKNFRGEGRDRILPAGMLFTPLLSNVQLKNAALATLAATALKSKGYKISRKAIRAGLKTAKCPGRLEVVQKNPSLVLDCAKDAKAFLELRKTIKKFFQYRRLVLILAVSDDKDIKSMIKSIASIVDLVVITKHSVKERAYDVKKLAREFKKYKIPAVTSRNIKYALQKALNQASKKDLILVTGSVFAVGEARDLCYNSRNNRKLYLRDY